MSRLREYQEEGADFLFAHDWAMMLAPVGSGKTAVAITAMAAAIEEGLVKRWLVFAPRRVATTVWGPEVAKWAPHLTVAVAVGTPFERRAAIEKAKTNILVINYDNIQWLFEQYPDYWYDYGVVFDELTKVKNAAGKRAKEVYTASEQFALRWGLTGSFTSEGVEDIHGQCKVITTKMLGRSKGAFLQKYFIPIDPKRGQWLPRASSFREIMDVVRPYAYVLDPGEYVSILPPIHYVNVEVEADLTKYHRMRKHLAVDMDGTEVIAANAGVMSQKLRQLSSGFIYNSWKEPDPTRPGEFIHHQIPILDSLHKIDALEDLLTENQHANALIIYNFDEELVQLKLRFPDAVEIDEKNIALWNQGKINKMLLHPKCLHPSTEVLTERRGWVRIVDVASHERVHDGVEFVSHEGCAFSGVQPVVSVFGIYMTPGHRLLINGEWVKAKDVQNIDGAKDKACYGYARTPSSGGQMHALRHDTYRAEAERYQGEQGEPTALPYVPCGGSAPHDKHTLLEHMVAHGAEGHQPAEQGLPTLRRLWARGISRVVKFYELYARYATNLLRQAHVGAHRQLQRVLKKELPVGYEPGAAEQQAQQSTTHVSREKNALGGVLPGNGSVARSDNCAPKPGALSCSSASRLPKVGVPKEPQISDVYDLVNCGPRNRFLIRNSAGEVFVSHNSGGHGLNLQFGGCHIVWLSLPWSLEEYEQVNGRLHRSGQKHDVWVYHILTVGTIDTRILGSLGDKRALSNLVIEELRT